MMRKNELSKIVKEEIEKMRHEGEVYTIPLSELVMMQMVGKFEDFLDNLTKNDNPNFGNAIKLIRETEKSVTTKKLFPSIVEKTIEAQFGDKNAALRELGQNAIDSYNLNDSKRDVVFSFSEEDKFNVLKVRDYGVGMDVKTLIKDLLIPYNSGKEFDHTKIGEHGIGWYSIVDLASLVKVTTRSRYSNTAVQALVYNSRNKWKTIILPNSSNGFSKELHNEDCGTEVIAYIDKEQSNAESVRGFLFQYLGMVDRKNANIIFGTDIINSVRESYETAEPAMTKINGSQKPLALGFSKRHISGKAIDERFRIRDKNLDKMLFTQRGLFIKYDSCPFDYKTIHSQLIEDLSKMGIDFWVDVPDNVTLTKGRNNIIADHSAEVLEAMYGSFENLFLDVILNDERILYHGSGTLQKSIANLFDHNFNDYKGEVISHTRKKYSFGRRISSRLAAAGSKTIDAGVYAAGKVGGAAKYMVTEFPKDFVSKIRVLSEDIRDDWPAIKERTKYVAKATGFVVGGLAALVGAGVGIYNLFGDAPLIYAAYAAGVATVGLGVHFLYKKAADLKNNWPYIRERLKQYFTKDPVLAPSVSLSESISLFFRSKYESLRNWIGLYVDVEEKRERKRKKKRDKISKKYLSNMQKDEFFNKILNKKIISAEYYYSPAKESEEQKKVQSAATIKDIFNEFSKSDENNNGNSWYSSYPSSPILESIQKFTRMRKESKFLEVRDVKISIDDMIDLYLQDRLRYGQNKGSMMFAHGECFVDEKNPIVSSVVGKLQEIGYTVKERYDVKLLEDHLDNMMLFGKKAAVGLYFLSGLGVVHLIASSMFKSIKNPFADADFYKSNSERWDAVKKWYNTHDVKGTLGRGAVKTAKGIGYTLALPALIPYWIGKGTFKKVVRPIAEKLDPSKYPEYAAVVGAWAKKKGVAIKERISRIETPRLDKIRENVGKKFDAWYTKSKWYELFGYGERSSTSFHNLEKGKLKSIVNHTNMGQAYLDYINVLEGIDKIVSDATGMKRFDITFSNKFLDKKNNEYDLGFCVVPKKVGRIFKKEKEYRKLDVDVGSYISDGSPTYFFQSIHRDLGSLRTPLPREKLLAGFSYFVLDMIIHAKTHAAIKKGHYDRWMLSKEPAHPTEFTDEKAELRRKVVNYIQKKNMKLEEYVGNLLSEDKELENHFYMIKPQELTRLVNMTRKRLEQEGQDHTYRIQLTGERIKEKNETIAREILKPQAL